MVLNRIQAPFNFSTVPSPNSRVYAHDSPGMYLGAFGGAVVGDYTHQEDQFMYTLSVVTASGAKPVASVKLGGVWEAHKTANTGTIVSDWTSVTNSLAPGTQDLKITQEEVRAIVGGTQPIVIDAKENTP